MVLVTAPDRKSARRLSRALVGERLAACANVVGGLRSIYRWKGKVRDDAEVLALPVAAGNAPYLAWLRKETGRG